MPNLVVFRQKANLPVATFVCFSMLLAACSGSGSSPGGQSPDQSLGQQQGSDGVVSSGPDARDEVITPKPLPAAPAVGLLTKLTERGAQPGHMQAVSDGSIFVSTVSHEATHMDGDSGNIILRVAPDGEIVDEIQVLNDGSDSRGSILGIAVYDQHLYATIRGPYSTVKINPATYEQEVFATYPTLPLCDATQLASNGTNGEYAECAATTTAYGQIPQGMVFLPDGSLLQTDEGQAVVWRVPAGGGEAEVWYSDIRFDGFFGLIDIEASDDGKTIWLLLDFPTNPSAAGLWQLTVDDTGKPAAAATQLWVAPSNDAPFGLELTVDGEFYISNTLGNQVVKLAADGSEISRFPNAVDNSNAENEIDGLAGIQLIGNRLIYGSQSFATSNRDLWALYGSEVEDMGRPLPAVFSGQ